MTLQRYSDDDGRFNITPVIDIVFLLVIFFMIVCQFIVAENFMVRVPDDISSGLRSEDHDAKITTVTVMGVDDGGVSYAVGSEIVAHSGSEHISESISEAIDRQFVHIPEDMRVVGLRVDKEIVFKDSQYAIAGISESSATDIKLSVIRKKMF